MLTYNIHVYRYTAVSVGVLLRKETKKRVILGDGERQNAGKGNRDSGKGT